MGFECRGIDILLVEKKLAGVFGRLMAHIHQATWLAAGMLLENTNVLLAFFFRARFHQHVDSQDDHLALALFLPDFRDAVSASSSVNSGMKMVCSRSGPVETMPILAPVSFSRKRRYSWAFFGSLVNSVIPSVDFCHPGIFSYTGSTFSKPVARAGTVSVFLPLIL